MNWAFYKWHLYTTNDRTLYLLLIYISDTSSLFEKVHRTPLIARAGFCSAEKTGLRTEACLPTVIRSTYFLLLFSYSSESFDLIKYLQFAINIFFMVFDPDKKSVNHTLNKEYLSQYLSLINLYLQKKNSVIFWYKLRLLVLIRYRDF